MDVGRGLDVSHVAAQSIKRPLTHQIFWALCLALLASSLEMESHPRPLLVSFCTQPLNMTRHGALPHPTSHQCQSEPRTNDSSLLRTPLWPCRTPLSTVSEYRQQGGTADRSIGPSHDELGLFSTCCGHGKFAKRWHRHSVKSSWLV